MNYLTTAQVAEVKGCSPRYVRQLAQNGKLEHIEKEQAANNRCEYLFPLSALTEREQIRWENQQRNKLGLEPVPVPAKATPKGSNSTPSTTSLTRSGSENSPTKASVKCRFSGFV